MVFCVSGGMDVIMQLSLPGFGAPMARRHLLLARALPEARICAAGALKATQGMPNNEVTVRRRLAKGMFWRGSCLMNKIVTAVLVTVALALMAAQVQAQSVIDAATPVAGDLSNGAGQTLVIDFANSQTLTVSGDVSNAGTVYAVSSNPLVTSGIISSVNVYNFAGASVTSIVPAGGIPGLPNIYASLANLTFNAQTSFQNEGIVAANSLSVNAPSIVNAPFSGGAGANPIIQSINNLNLAATTITNQGQIASQLANINIIAATVNNTATIAAAANLAISGVSTGLLVNNLGV